MIQSSFQLYNFENSKYLSEKSFENLVVQDLSKSGFIVKKQFSVNGGRADIYAKKDDFEFILELKLYRKTNPKIIADAVHQLFQYTKGTNYIPVIGLLDSQINEKNLPEFSRRTHFTEKKATDKLLNFLSQFGICVLGKNKEEKIQIRFAETLKIVKDNIFLTENYEKVKDKIQNNRFRRLLEE